MAKKKSVTVKGYTRTMPTRSNKPKPKRAAQQRDLFGGDVRTPKLKFKLRGKMSPGCDYAVVAWTTGNTATRRLVSCHRTVGSAREALAAFKERPMYKASKKGHAAVYNVYTGARRKS